VVKQYQDMVTYGDMVYAHPKLDAAKLCCGAAGGYPGTSKTRLPACILGGYPGTWCKFV
jgi:hypothetical protein